MKKRMIINCDQNDRLIKIVMEFYGNDIKLLYFQHISLESVTVSRLKSYADWLLRYPESTIDP